MAILHVRFGSTTRASATPAASSLILAAAEDAFERRTPEGVTITNSHYEGDWNAEITGETAELVANWVVRVWIDSSIEEEPTTYTVSDQGSADDGLSYDDAVARIAEWYEDVDQWADGNGDDETHEAVAKAIESVAAPNDDGDINDLRKYASDIREAVAEAIGGKDFHGHGRYSVSAADSIGLGLDVTEDE